MEEVVSATRAVREFSDLLNSIKFKGRTVIIERGGKPVARMAPVEAPGKTARLKDLPRLLGDLPELGPEAEALEKDLQEITKTQPPLPSVAPWE
jgi:antitoxin (DNA-binding transcriptional repressor) of toxin-antitoxin stability system